VCSSDLVRRIVRSYGREELELTNGCRYKIVAPTPGGARGLTANLVIIDELREHKTDDAWAALGYTTQTTGGPTWVSSNAGDQSSTVLNRIREQALASIAAPGSDPSLYYAEWSADPVRAADDRQGWAEANPAMGRLIDEATLAARYKSDPPNVWRTEALCQWVDVLDSPWPPEAWADCYEAGLTVTEGVPTFLAIDVTPDRKHAALVAVQQLGDDRIGAHLLDTWDADGAIDDLKVAGRVAEVARKLGARSVAFDRWTAAGIASRLAGAGIAVGDCSGPAFAQACDELLGAMVSGRLAHAGQDTLTEHVLSTAKKWTADGGWRIVRAKSSGPVAGAVALAMAVHYAVEPLPRAEVVFG
jgi:phage terminase large subunit-like protein